MEQTSPSGSSDSKKELLSLWEILRVFNNPINEEQAWAVCHQCAQYFHNTQDRTKYQDFYKHGSRSVRLKKDGDIVIYFYEEEINRGSGKGPPVRRRNSVTGKDIKVVTESDAVQALGLVIYQALDYGMGETEERHLSRELEHLIEFMTNPDDEEDAPNSNDEGIEKDAKDNNMFPEVMELCEHHLSNNEDPGHHYKAVCRALLAEAMELVSFLDKISAGNQVLSKEKKEDMELDGLGRSDWARLWVQIMKELRRGVRLKKMERVNLTPQEYELTPFEILLEDIRTRRYTLNKIMVNGDIPTKVKSDAHAMILDFIRSRPPLHSVKDRILRSPPKRELDPVEKLMIDIRSQPKLRPVRDGRLVVETSRTKLNSDDEYESPLPVRKVIKPDFDLIRNFEDESEDGDSIPSSRRSSVASPSPEREMRSWRRAVVRDLTSSKSRPVFLQRRNTITVCETPPQVSPSSPPEKCIPEIPEENEAVRPRGRLTRREPVIRAPSSSSQHVDPPSRLRRTTAVHKTHVSANDLRERLKLRLHSCTSPTRTHSPVRAHVSLRACTTKTIDDDSAFMDENPSLNRTFPQQQVVQRSASVSDIKSRPRPMLRSKTMSEIQTPPDTTPMVKSAVKDDTSVPSDPSPPRPTPRPRPVPRPRASKSPSRSSSPSPSESKSSEKTDRHNVDTTSPSKKSPIPSPRPSPTPRSRPHRSQSQRLQRHSMHELGAMPENSVSHPGRTASPERKSPEKFPKPTSSNGACETATPPQNFSPLNVRDLLHVSWSGKAGLGAESASPTNSSCLAPISSSEAASSSKWQHPIECLSLTLEEVTHIRTVLTKAELESIISNKELHTLLSKGKTCFTCRQVKFSMFGQWGTRCKICKRNVCNNCLRKMNVPTEHFQNIPVHTLSPIPLSPDTMDIIRAYESTGSVPHSPTSQRKLQQNLENKSTKPRTLQRSHTISAGAASQPIMLPNKNLLKGPQMSICCDCKSMIMEIIRTSRTSIALINQGKKDLPPPSTETSKEDKGLNLSTLSLNIKHLFSSNSSS